MSATSTPLCQYLSHLPEKNRESQKYEDLLNGKSHEKLAKTIADHIKFCTVETPRTIGIQGKWGSGKSHLIELITQRLDEQCFHIFKFDLWNYQEEASRRVFLTELLKSLKIIKDLDNIDCHAADKKIGDDVIRQKFEKLFAKQVTKIIENKTPANVNLLIFVLAIALVQPFFSAAVFIQEKCDNLVIFPILVMLVFFVAILYALTNGYKEVISLRRLAQFQLINEKPILKSEEYESNNEYSIVEFHNFMNDVSDWFVKCDNTKKGNKIIVVFDNIDRVSSDISVSVWKLILNIISNEKNLNFFYLIPFDKEHLNTGYIGEDKNGFISKIFPIIYKLPEPLNIDIRNYFQRKFKLIFENNTEYEITSLRTLFLNYKESPTLRDVSIFINELKQLDLQSDDSINLKVKALYLLRKNLIATDPLNLIINKCYLSYFGESCDIEMIKRKRNNTKAKQDIESNHQTRIIEHMFTDDELLQSQITALHYGIDLDTASYLPLYNYLKSEVQLLVKNGSTNDSRINEYIDHSRYADVIELLLEDVDIVEIDSLILMLEILDRSKKITENAWIKLKDLKIKYDFYYYDERDSSDVLLKKLSFDQKLVIDFLDSIMISINKLIHDDKGDLHYKACLRLSDFLSSQRIDYKLTFDTESAESAFWMTYISTAKENLDKYVSAEIHTRNFISSMLTDVNGNLDNDLPNEAYFTLDQISVLNIYFEYSNFSESVLVEYIEKFNILLSKISNNSYHSHTYHYWIRIKKTLFNRSKILSGENVIFSLGLNESQFTICLRILLDAFYLYLEKQNTFSSALDSQMSFENLVDLVCFMIVNNMESAWNLIMEEIYKEYPIRYRPNDPFHYIKSLANKLSTNDNVSIEAIEKPEENFINVLSTYVANLDDFLDCYINSESSFNKNELRDYWNSNKENFTSNN